MSFPAMIASQKLQNIGSQTSSTKRHGQVVVALGSKHRDHIPHLEIIDLEMLIVDDGEMFT